MPIMPLADAGFDLNTIGTTLATAAQNALGTGVTAIVPVIAAIIGVKIVIGLVKKHTKA